MRDIGKGGKKPIEELNGERPRKAKLERLRPDVTERKKAEEMLRESQERYRALVENTVLGVTVIDTNYKIIMANTMLAKLFNKPASDFVGKNCFREYEKREAVCPHCPAVQAMASGETTEVETQGVRDDGSCFYVWNHAIPLFGPDGVVQGFIELVEDITERKKAEEELRKFKAISDRAGYGSAISDTEGNLTYVNEMFAKMHGYMPEELIGKHLSIFHTKEQIGNVQRLAEQLIETGSYVDEEVWHKRKDGTVFPTSMTGTCLTDEKGKPIFMAATAIDITERKKAEQQILKDQAQLKSLASQLTLVEERERRRIAVELHDRISQSLVISKIKLDALRKSGRSRKLDKSLEDVCNSIGQTIQDTRTLTFDLSSPVLYELGFETAVSEWLTSQIQEKRGLAVEFEDDGRPKPLDDDVRILLFRDVRELLINVVKHSGARKVKVSITKLDNHICVTVEDDGVGFDPVEVLSTAAKRGEFGLFSIRERLENLGGHLRIDSAPGCGCKVTMTAPLKQKEMTQ